MLVYIARIWCGGLWWFMHGGIKHRAVVLHIISYANTHSYRTGETMVNSYIVQSLLNTHHL